MVAWARDEYAERVSINDLFRKLTGSRKPEGERGIARLGHREYVGGLWDQMGVLMFDMMIEQGLEPRHVLCDVACGSLRGGVRFIEYLDAGNYLGIDKEQGLLDAGLQRELSDELREAKRPELVCSDAFEFGKFSKRADFALAQSLFSHLPEPIIEVCFSKLFHWMNPGGVFLATFFEGSPEDATHDRAHDHEKFTFSRERMERFGSDVGFVPRYIGDWNHPRGQVLVRYEKKS